MSEELFLGVVALQMPIQKNHYMCDKVPFPIYCHICASFSTSLRDLDDEPAIYKKRK